MGLPLIAASSTPFDFNLLKRCQYHKMIRKTVILSLKMSKSFIPPALGTRLPLTENGINMCELNFIHVFTNFDAQL